MRTDHHLRYPLPYIILASIITFFTPFILRIRKNSTIPGEFPYVHLLSSPYKYISQLSHTTILITHLLLTILFTICIFVLLKRHTENNFLILCILGICILSPTTIFLSSFSYYLLPLLFIAITLNITHTKFSKISPAFLLPLLFFDWVSLVAAVMMIISYLFFTEKKQLIPLFIPFLVVYVLVHIISPIPFNAEPVGSLKTFVSDIGSIHGLSLFTLTLTAIGVVLSRRQKARFTAAYIASLLLFILFLIAGHPAILFLAPILLIFAGCAFHHLWTRRWSLPTIRTLTLLVLIYGILFSSISYVQRTHHIQPNQAVFDSVAWLSQHPSYKTSIILSHPQKGFWLQTKTNRVFATPTNPKTNMTKTILMSRDFLKTKKLLEQNNIELIWIDKKMKNGQVWKNKDDGLLYLFSNPRFLKVYDSDDIEIWRFK